MIQVKKYLDDIVEYTYRNNDKIKRYKSFYVEVINENRKGFHGDYSERTHHIRIFNLYRDDVAIIATTIHELAHHIDTMNRGYSDHSKEFYKIFQELLYMALNMGIFDKEQFLSATKDASDSNKIEKMIVNYVPEYVEYKNDMKKLIVYNCYDIKDELKKYEFLYNKVNRTWEKEVDSNELAEITSVLENLKAEYKVVDATDFTFEKKIYIVAGKGSYDFKDELKSEGFSYSKDIKGWKKEIEYSKEFDELSFYREKWTDIEFGILR